MTNASPPPELPRSMGIGEAAFHALADQVREACVFLSDRHGRYVAVNHAFAEWVGRPESEILGRTAYDLWPCLTAERDALDDLRVLGGEAVEREEPRPHGGQARPVRARRTPIRGGDGAVEAVLGVFRDVTADADEGSRRQAARMELVGRLASGVAHDFNNLLTALLGHLALLRDFVPTAGPQQELLGGAEKAAAQAADLTRQLLAFVRAEAAGPEPTDWNVIVGQVVGLLRRTFDPRIQIEVRVQAGLPKIAAVSTQLAQLLLNLCLNARDAMPHGGRLLIETSTAALSAEAARLHPRRRTGAFVRLRVADTGEGIPPAVQARMFDPAFTTKSPGMGTGLGLAIVQSVVQQHNGWIECVSSVGQGACFDVFLPRMALESESAPAPYTGQACEAGSACGVGKA